MLEKIAKQSGLEEKDQDYIALCEMAAEEDYLFKNLLEKLEAGLDASPRKAVAAAFLGLLGHSLVMLVNCCFVACFGILSVLAMKQEETVLTYAFVTLAVFIFSANRRYFDSKPFNLFGLLFKMCKKQEQKADPV